MKNGSTRLVGEWQIDTHLIIPAEALKRADEFKHLAAAAQLVQEDLCR